MKTLLVFTSLALSGSALAADKAKFLQSAEGLKIELHPSGEFAVSAYPEAADAALQLKTIRTFNLGTSLAEACEKMPARIKMLKSSFVSETSKATYRDGLLNLNQISLNVQSPLWLQPGSLEKDVLQQSRLNAVFAWNPLTIKARDLSFFVEPAAKSLEVETAEALGKRLQAFKALLLGPSSPLTTSSVPLVCDLQAGRIQVQLNLSAEHKDFQAFAWPKGIEPLPIIPVDPVQEPLEEGDPSEGDAILDESEEPMEDSEPLPGIPEGSEEEPEAEPVRIVPHGIKLKLKWQD